MKNRYIVKAVERKLNEIMDAGKTVYHIYDRQTQKLSLAYYLTEERANKRCVAKNATT